MNENTTNTDRNELATQIIDELSDCDVIDHMYEGGTRFDYDMAAEKMSALIATKVREARVEQVMQDFLTLQLEIDGDIDEAQFIEWRTSRIAELQNTEDKK